MKINVDRASLAGCQYCFFSWRSFCSLQPIPVKPRGGFSLSQFLNLGMLSGKWISSAPVAVSWGQMCLVPQNGPMDLGLKKESGWFSLLFFALKFRSCAALGLWWFCINLNICQDSCPPCYWLYKGQTVCVHARCYTNSSCLCDHDTICPIHLKVWDPRAFWVAMQTF